LQNIKDFIMASASNENKHTALRAVVWFAKFHLLVATAVVGFLAVAFLTSDWVLYVLEGTDARNMELRSQALEGLSISRVPDISTTFALPNNGVMSDEALAYMKYYGFIKFDGALSVKEVESVRKEKFRIEAELIAEGRTEINGVPLFRGTGSMSDSIHRIPFSSSRSKIIKDIIHDERFHSVKALIASFKGAGFSADSVRIGDREKDGVVFNSYMNLGDFSADSSKKKSVWSRNQLGWHTDGLRDIAYLRAPKAMLNFGIHLDTVDPNNGDAGLCLIPGTHNQHMWGFYFRKLYFFSNEADEKEICVKTTAGDVTVHDGRLWHRVEPAKEVGEHTLRRSIYVPYLTNDQPVEIKSKASSVPAYHRFAWILRMFKGGL